MASSPRPKITKPAAASPPTSSSAADPTKTASSSSSTSSTTTSMSSTANVPQVLTKAVIPELAISRLDASDVLECYYLTRQTSFSSIPIRFTKVALGLRYRPRVQAGVVVANHHHTKGGATTGPKKLELTIEYGPSRAGEGLQYEAIPHIVRDEDEQQHQDTQTLIYDNEARIYYTESIDRHVYTTANYLASVSGVVLNHLLTQAVDFVQGQRRHRRYQPFVVIDGSSSQNQNDNDDAEGEEAPGEEDEAEPRKLLRSSSDVDFLQFLYRVLADMGVQLQPVILPNLYQVRLHAQSFDKVQVGASVQRWEIIDFYQNLYQCLQAIATADYSNYNTTSATTNTKTTTTTTIAPTAASSAASASSAPNQQVSLPSMAPSKTTIDSTTSKPSITTKPTSDPPTRRRHLLDESNRQHPPLNQQQRSVFSIPEDVETKDAATPPEDGDNIPSTSTSRAMGPSLAPSATATIVAATTEPTSSSNGMASSHTEQAVQAATEAQEAAQKAHEASNTPDAQSAAQAAATAAQKAVDATEQQANSILRDAITSGDQVAAPQTASLCFQNPLFRLSINKNDSTATATTTAYIFWDGAIYYRVNLTSPYISVVSMSTALPQPPVAGIGGEDFVDFLIFLIVAGFSILGFMLLLQQVMGKNYVQAFRPLYRYQRWFFQPTHYDLNAMDDESVATRGVGHEYTFGEDAIPFSMGGRRSGYSTTNDIRVHVEHDLNGGDDSVLGDMELVNRVRTNSNGSFHQHPSFHSDGGSEEALDRLFRDPNLVDLPDLQSSKSTPALPWGYPVDRRDG